MWFGSSGLVPALIWAWHCRPRIGRMVQVTLGPITGAQLGAYRTLIEGGRCERLEVFRDELPPAALAALRRDLKAACSARGGAEHVEPI
jgi:hypothetical protein